MVVVEEVVVMLVVFMDSSSAIASAGGSGGTGSCGMKVVVGRCPLTVELVVVKVVLAWWPST